VRAPAALGLVLATAACTERPPIDVASVNALVPIKYRYKLQFEVKEVTSGVFRRYTYTLPVPKGWKIDGVIGSVDPVDTVANGNSSFGVWSSCDGPQCVGEDWNAKIDEDYRYAYKLRDERSPGRRVIVTQSALDPSRDDVGFAVYWSKPSEVEYHECGASLSPALKDAEAAFERACELAIVHENDCGFWSPISCLLEAPRMVERD
jgi:hypothetical protein